MRQRDLARRSVTWAACFALIVMAGCKAEPIKPNVHAADATAKIPGIVAVAHEDDAKSNAALITALADVDPAVRLFAIENLRRANGESFGYRVYDAEDVRDQAIKEWQRWYAGRYGEGTFPEPTETPPNPSE